MLVLPYNKRKPDRIANVLLRSQQDCLGLAGNEVRVRRNQQPVKSLCV